ncbi:presenilins-associated rhomboid-like protein, mitochondrial [Oppia nitens]|uniref:presenilins-associated rhomboid-like protein, mitochondrial n=1 Tax=Oppia nitens TaxID=1686743 RepID=UPI0023DABCFE|nr:presenilins-associated rhomboid-like protein, mitochondrial [Oppia nitens]
MLSLFRQNICSFNANKCLTNVFKRNVKNFLVSRSFTNRLSNNESNNSVKTLIKPLIFTIGFSGTVYTVSIVYNYENSLFGQTFDWRQNFYTIQDNHIKRKTGSLRNELNKWWQSKDISFKVFSSIAAINVLVFLCWKSQRLHPFMFKYFTAYFDKQVKCWPMLLSTFSHYSITHLIFNLVVLHSFTKVGISLFGVEQFVALYLSSGVISSYGSYMTKVLLKRSGSSLGASGAILGILASCCIARPDLELVIIFLPFFTISSGMALKAIIAMDSFGVLLGWKLFDHSAHLAGTLFGVWYTSYGQHFLTQHRHQVIDIWQRIKSI